MNPPTFDARDILDKFIRIRKSTSKTLKENFYGAFCDTESHRYKRYLNEVNWSVSSAMSYDWKLVTKEDLLHSPPFKGTVYVGWDFEDYYVAMYGLGRYYLFQMPFSKFLYYYESFPEGTYVFDENLEYAIVSTHLEFDKYIPKMRLYTRANKV